MKPEAVSRYPLEWPAGWVRTLPRHRQRASFQQVKKEYVGTETRTRQVSLSVLAATQRLEEQLERLGGINPTLSTNVSLRLDGRPRSDQEPTDVGAAVYFVFKGKATVFACDKWNRVADNIAAIAAHIDALRRVDRYGVGSIEQALAGYKSLPADSAADWRQVFGFPAGSVPSHEALKAAYKDRARHAHPDQGGTDEAMMHINRALEYALQELAL